MQLLQGLEPTWGNCHVLVNWCWKDALVARPQALQTIWFLPPSVFFSCSTEILSFFSSKPVSARKVPAILPKKRFKYNTLLLMKKNLTVQISCAFLLWCIRMGKVKTGAPKSTIRCIYYNAPAIVQSSKTWNLCQVKDYMQASSRSQR